MTRTLTRRDLLKSAAAAGAGYFLSPTTRAAEQKSKYRTALIGSGWWGMNILGEAMAAGPVPRSSALCDVDQRLLDPAAAEVEKLTGDRPEAATATTANCWRRRSRRSCIVATPDHWHPLQTIAAVQGRRARLRREADQPHDPRGPRDGASAARAAGRVVQVGTHRRVSPHNVSGREFIRSGKLGKIGMVRAFVHYGGGPETPAQERRAAARNWTGTCGAARPRCGPSTAIPNNPWGGGIHPRGFRSYLDYANGTLGDWGIHWMDQILWITGEKWPQEGLLHRRPPDQRPARLTAEEQTSDAPDHQVATFEFDELHRVLGAPPVRRQQRRERRERGLLLLRHRRARSTWAGRRAGRSTRPTRRKPVVHEDPQLAQARRPEHQGAVGRFPGRHPDRAPPGQRHRGGPSLHQRQPAGHAVAQAGPQRRSGTARRNEVVGRSRGQPSLRREYREAAGSTPECPRERLGSGVQNSMLAEKGPAIRTKVSIGQN